MNWLEAELEVSKIGFTYYGTDIHYSDVDHAHADAEMTKDCR